MGKDSQLGNGELKVSKKVDKLIVIKSSTSKVEVRRTTHPWEVRDDKGNLIAKGK